MHESSVELSLSYYSDLSGYSMEDSELEEYWESYDDEFLDEWDEESEWSDEVEDWMENEE